MNLTTDQKRYLEEWMSFLRIPSVSADPTQKEAVRQAADWVKNALDKVGCNHTEIIPTAGHPIYPQYWFMVITMCNPQIQLNSGKVLLLNL
jgi:acetylornithine deacetylase/succinyl-diaminopimelate desuccinylase-like protein